MNLLPKKFFVTSGCAVSKVSDLNAFDQALKEAKKANETDDEVEQLSAEKVGRLTKKLGFAKERTGKSRQRLICWDETRVTKIVSSYGLQMALPLSPEKPSEPSVLSALASKQADSNKEGSKYCPPYCPPKTEADPSVRADSRTERTVTDKE